MKSKRAVTALITGASQGIGYELSHLFARDGYNLLISARREEKLCQVAHELEEAYGVQVRVIPNDLADPVAARELFDAVQEQSPPIDALVNNAGFGLYGPFAETDIAVELAMIQVNITALTHLTKLFLPDMLKRGAGKIMNVASVAAFQPGPFMAIYYASKAYVLSFSEAIASELRGSGVTVTAFCPGPTATGFQERARLDASRWMRIMRTMDAKTVARIGYRGMMRGKTVVIPGIENKLIAFFGRFVPRNILTGIVKRMQSHRSTHSTK